MLQSAAMRVHSNLISDSNLVNQTIELLKENGGSLAATDVANHVLQIPTLDEDLAAMLVGDLTMSDPRLSLNENNRVELVLPNFDSRRLCDIDYVVFDTETTGAKLLTSRMTEIGAYRVRNGKIVAEYETLINPEIEIPPFISALTGITNQMVARAPRFCDIASDLLDFIGDSVLVAHNAQFDMRFLNFEIGRVFSGYKLHNPNLCTVRLSRKLLPDLENHRLHTVARHYSITIQNRHRAGGDALATAHIFINLLSQLETLGVKDLAMAKRIKSKI